MSTNSYFDSFKSQWRAFGRAENGNVAVIFAVSTIPVIGLVGAAIDYSRANAMRASMQAAVDSTALAISRNAASQTSSQLQTSAQTFFNTAFSSTGVQGLQVAATYSSTPSSQVVVTASANIKPRFMNMSFFGVSKIPVLVSSTTTWGNIRLRVALALDNTGSMASAGKMDALKVAAKNLVDQLKAAATSNEDVYVSIIPFSRDVNVGVSNKNANWLKWSKPGQNSDGWDQNNGSCTGWGWGSYYNEYDCTSHGKTWTASNHDNWNGCVMDRDQNYDTTAAAPVANDSGSPSTLFWPHQYSYCPVALKPLSYDWTAVKSKIDSMTPSGSTNQAIGLAWAWLSLLQSAPLSSPAEDSNYQYQKVIVLLSDGLNTQDRWYGNGYSPSSQVDARQQILCENVKAAGITLYTVQVNTDGDPTSTLLQNCASSSDKFFLLTASSQIVTTFNQIGTSLSKLRIAQ
ncbi:MAG: TadE/TadG family type IV pilus assembly protein [Xanthobacteraceae bacterium]